MTQQRISRRAFLRTTGDVARGSCIALTLPMILAACNRATEARLNGEDFQTLSEEEAREFDAIAARIIPSDGTPGATEAGVIYFIDNVLGDGREEQHATLQEGLRQLQTAAVMNYDTAYFYLLEPSQQDQLLTDIEKSEFFTSIRYLTVAGMFSLPEYGGNRDNLGFDLIGFEDRHAWQPPFGHYDKDYAETGE
ncbi:MAG: gluconate 2-dehydrogenase subunit 3 family protein [Proteobacteria bacterium]|nr:gluconate 2-dehydrogenase subunit 3 family protein [Pseudomonadota bacterium]